MRRCMITPVPQLEAMKSDIFIGYEIIACESIAPSSGVLRSRDQLPSVQVECLAHSDIDTIA